MFFDRLWRFGCYNKHVLRFDKTLPCVAGSNQDQKGKETRQNLRQTVWKIIFFE